MAKAVFELPDGTACSVDVPTDWSLMEAARRDGIEGIVAECGGGAICGTCHVQVGEPWFDLLEPAGMSEQALLEIVPEHCPTSRLACQIIMTDTLDGIQVRVPAEQLSM